MRYGIKVIMIVLHRETVYTNFTHVFFVAVLLLCFRLYTSIFVPSCLKTFYHLLIFIVHLTCFMKWCNVMFIQH